MGTIEYTIVNGVAPFNVELSPLSSTTHTTTGTFQFVNIPNGDYTLIVTDSNDCVFEQNLTVNPNAPTTTTTTMPSDDSIILGNTDAATLIFNVNSTNKSGQFGDGEVYLWLKTTNGEPLTTNKVVTYSFSGNNTTIAFNNLSDEIHAEVIENIGGPSQSINGQLLLKVGFIETFFKYTIINGVGSNGFRINLDSVTSWLNTSIPLVDGTNIYGVRYIDNNNAIMIF